MSFFHFKASHADLFLLLAIIAIAGTFVLPGSAFGTAAVCLSVIGSGLKVAGALSRRSH